MPAVPDHPQFSVRAEGARDGRTVVEVAGEVDVATAGELEAFVGERLARDGVLLDLGHVTFLDSSGVRVLDSLMRRAAQHGWDLRVDPALREEVRQILELTGLLRVLPLAAPAEEGPR
jgi:anti-anti-sigma factor